MPYDSKYMPPQGAPMQPGFPLQSPRNVMDRVPAGGFAPPPATLPPANTDMATGGPDPAGTYGMGDAGAYQDQPPPMPGPLEKLLIASQLAAQGMNQQAQALYQQATQEMQAMQAGAGGAMDQMGGMAQDGMDAVRGLFK